MSSGHVTQKMHIRLPFLRNEDLLLIIPQPCKAWQAVASAQANFHLLHNLTTPANAASNGGGCASRLSSILFSPNQDRPVVHNGYPGDLGYKE